MDAAAPVTRHRSACPYCGVGCGVIFEVQGGRITKVSGDKAHPTNFGRLCTKGASCHIPITAPGRAERAFARMPGGNDHAPLPMDEAIRRTAQGFRRIIDRDGPDAMALYVSGQMSIEAQYLANKLAKGFIRTKHIESNSRLCMASAGSGYKLSLGSDAPPGSYQDFEGADLFFVIGANMADCHPILFLRMMDRVKQGAKLIVIDPRRNATAEKADLFLQIRPGTDLALLNGLLHLLHAAGHTDPAFIAAHTEGWEAMPAFLADYPPEKVADLTGLPVADILRAAEMIGAAAEWMSLWTMGLNQSTHGTWNTNALCNLHLATGAICRPGSGPFSLTGQPNAMGGREMGYMGPGLPGQRSGLNPKDRAFAETAWNLPPGTLRPEAGGGTVDMFRDMSEGRIKGLWVICTNPVASTANRSRVLDALKAAELVVTQDAFLDTETNRHADIILPAALWAEGDGVMVNSERNMTLCPKVVDPPGEAMADWQIIARVACEMGYAEAFTYASAAQVFAEITGFDNPATGYDIRGASHARLGETPLQWPLPPGATEDRNPIRYLGENGPVFATPSGRAAFLPRPHMDPAEMPDADFPMVLNTGRLQHQWHTLTKTGKVPHLNKLNPGPFLELHPEDATALGISERDRVELRSRRGRAVLPAQISDRVRPGTCFAPFHWNDSFGEDLAVNAATSDATDPISQQPEFKFAAVALARIAGPMDDPPQPERTSALKHALTIPALAQADPRIDAFARLVGLPATPAPSLSPVEVTWLSGFTTGLRVPEGFETPGVPQIPGAAPLSAETRHYVNGLLAGLFARAPAPEPIEAEAPSRGPVLLLWASQTGHAEGFAFTTRTRLEGAGYAVKLLPMAQVKPAELTSAARLLILTSTFGDGDPPDNGADFWRMLSQDTAPRLTQTSHATLAFGDSSYASFCGFGRKLDARLAELGSTPILPRADCEPDFEDTSEAWLTALLAALGTDEATAPPPEASAPAKTFTRKAPLSTRLIRNTLLSGPGAQKEVRQFGFALPETGFTYRAGDALGVWPENCPDLVAELLNHLGLSPEAPVRPKDQDVMPLAEALRLHLDIARPTRGILEALATRCPDAIFAPLLDPAKSADLDRWLWTRQIPDLLADLRLQISPADLVALLRPLQPRQYSISSSPHVRPGEVELTVSTLRYACGARARKGVCSTFLADRCAGRALRIFLQPSAYFHPPEDGARDIIMIGPGTGIAPFRGFLQDRQATGATGRNWLFFGEQHAATDYYYRSEIEAWQASGHLSRLDLAFSRDQAEKIYVQQRMMEQGVELWSWIANGAAVYVCGDANRMAKDVDFALKAVIRQHGGVPETAAEEYLRAMQERGLYARDVY